MKAIVFDCDANLVDSEVLSNEVLVKAVAEHGLFLHAAKAMGVAPEECAVVEDSLPGIQAGLAAGMTVFVLEPHGVAANVPGQVTVLRDLLALRTLLTDSAAEPGVACERPPRIRLEPSR